MCLDVPGQSGGGFGSSMKRFGSVSAINVTSGSKQRLAAIKLIVIFARCQGPAFFVGNLPLITRNL